MAHASSHAGPVSSLDAPASCGYAAGVSSQGPLLYTRLPSPDSDVFYPNGLTNTLSRLPFSSIFTSLRRMSGRDNYFHFRDQQTDPERWSDSPFLPAWFPHLHPVPFPQLPSRSQIGLVTSPFRPLWPFPSIHHVKRPWLTFPVSSLPRPSMHVTLGPNRPPTVPQSNVVPYLSDFTHVSSAWYLFPPPSLNIKIEFIYEDPAPMPSPPSGPLPTTLR